MKKKDLKTGMIVEDRRNYYQNIINMPYKLITHVAENGYYFLQSPDPEHFWISSHCPEILRESFSGQNTKYLKLVR